MPKLTEAYRIVVIAEKVLEKVLLEQCVKLGAKGYNCLYCFGKGEHGVVEDLFAGPERSCVRIETITTKPVAESIMDYVNKEALSHYPITAFIDMVQVDARDTFYR